MSLLQRLGQTKEQAIKNSFEDSSSTLRNEKFKRAKESPAIRKNFKYEEEFYTDNFKSEEDNQKDNSQNQAASSFAGRRGNIVQRDEMQELRIKIHQRLVDEMIVEEQQIISQGEPAREQIKNLISSYCERELENTAQPLSRVERQQLVEVICDELLGLGPLENLLKNDEITEIMVNGPQDIFIEKNGKLMLSSVHFYNETHLMNIIVTIEDAAELKLQQRHVVRLETRPANLEGTGAITIRDLVRNALRMRPDRIVVGEVRSGEALDMLQAMNTGHDGSLTTAHANSPRDVLSRLETMVLMAGMELPLRAIRTQIASAINIILQQSRMSDGSRKVTHITEVQGMEDDIIILQDLFHYVQTSIDGKGKIVGHFEPLGLHPSCLEKFRIHGVKIPLSIFDNRG